MASEQLLRMGSTIYSRLARDKPFRLYLCLCRLPSIPLGSLVTPLASICPSVPASTSLSHFMMSNFSQKEAGEKKGGESAKATKSDLAEMQKKEIVPIVIGKHTTKGDIVLLVDIDDENNTHVLLSCPHGGEEDFNFYPLTWHELAVFIQDGSFIPNEDKEAPFLSFLRRAGR